MSDHLTMPPCYRHLRVGFDGLVFLVYFSNFVKAYYYNCLVNLRYEVMSYCFQNKIQQNTLKNSRKNVVLSGVF